MDPLYNEQISQDLSSIDGILASLFGLGSLAFTGVSAVVAIVCAVVSLLISIAWYLLQSIPLFIMARKTGFKHAWMAFFPYTNDFLTFMLPIREFNIFNWIKSEHRDTMALIYLCMSILGGTALSIITPILAPIPVIGPIVASFGGTALLFFIYAFRWRMYYDLLKTFGQESNAMWVSIISLFIPWLFLIFTIFSCKNDPDYGRGNYYKYRK
ncbi:MAG: hypothetical protein J6A73_00170 [Lachnospiraceae bacterium]|nr:hypothetical protein [Lachnospiraceae bacterium]